MKVDIDFTFRDFYAGNNMKRYLVDKNIDYGYVSKLHYTRLRVKCTIFRLILFLIKFKPTSVSRVVSEEFNG